MFFALVGPEGVCWTAQDFVFFLFIIPTYHNSESPRIMVETTTDVPTVIYRCHVNSKWVTYQMRESSMPQSMSAKESVED